MRIVHVITRLIIGGAQENTILSCEGLSRKGHEVHLVTGPTSGPEGSLVERARDGPYQYHELPELIRQISVWHDMAGLWALRRLFKVLKPDVVHTHSSKAGILGRLGAARSRVPTIVHTIHGMSFNRTQPWLVQRAFATAERYCAQKCHAIVSVADAMTQQALAAGIGRPEMFETIRSGMVLEDFDPARERPLEMRRRWGIPDEAIVVGTVARLFPNKGYEQLIPILERAARAEPRLRFVWIGDGSARGEYEAELSRLGLRDRVTITGLLAPVEMPRVLAAMDMLAHSSQWEGLPRAVVQALLMERPAVSFDIDGAPEVVVPGETGELVPLGDIPRFSDAIVKLARDSEMRARYGRTGRKRCLAEFDHRVMVDRLESLYSRISYSIKATV